MQLLTIAKSEMFSCTVEMLVNRDVLDLPWVCDLPKICRIKLESGKSHRLNYTLMEVYRTPNPEPSLQYATV